MRRPAAAIRAGAMPAPPMGVACVMTAWLALALGAVAAEERSPLEFMRVHAPPGRTQDVPLDADRYVPMSALEFDRAVAALNPAGRSAPTPRFQATSARYEAGLDGQGRLVGSLAFDVADAGDLAASFLPLGDIDASGGTLRSAAGVGEVVVFGLPDGTAAVRTPGAGSYACEFTGRPGPPGAGVHRLPLVPALTTSLTLRLPPGARPLVSAPAVVRPGNESADADGLVAWRIETGPAPAISFRLESREDRPVVRAWTEVGVRGRRADVVTSLQPDHGWMAGTLVLGIDAGLEPTAVRAAAREASGFTGELAWRFGAGRTLLVDVPPSMNGSRAAVVIVGVAPVAAGRLQEIPVVRPAPATWAGGGVTLNVTAEFAIDRIELRDAVAVGEDVAARWPAADPAAAGGGVADDSGARMYFEPQSSTAVIAASVRPRPVELDVARVTTVEISPRIVLGRAACDLRVSAGEAFEANAAIGDGWLIDSVEAIVETETAPAQAAPRDEEAARAAIPVEWRRVGPAGAGQLRVAFAEAATRSRSVGLRISGHRAGIPLGATFATADMDMVRFAGESAAAIDFRAGSDTVVEIEGGAVAAVPLDGRLAALVEPGSSQGRLRRGEPSPSQTARLVQRRSPLAADVTVELTARDGQLTESFAVTCRAESGDLDSVVVHVSEALGEDVEWTRTDAGGGTILARRLERRDPVRGESGSLPGIAESWLLEFNPAARDTVGFRGVRGAEFTGPRPVPLAWVEAATTSRGILRVRGEGAAWPRFLNRRLRELPPNGADTERSVGEFAYEDPRTMLGAEREPPAELLPADPAAARAWAWRETTSCWAHASGRIEWESVFEIDNHGRQLVALTVPAGLSVESITIDGSVTPFDGVPSTGGEVKVPLPPRRGRVVLAIRGSAVREPRFGCWRIDPVTCVLDAPVLERRLRVMLPPDLDLLVPTAGEEPGWLERLFAASTQVRNQAAAIAGFRAAEIKGGEPRAAGGIVVVRRRLVATVAIAAGLAALTGAFGAACRRPGAVALCVVGVAIAALWLAPPLVAVARAAWWGGLTGLVCGWFGSLHRLVPACAAIAVFVASPADLARAEAAADSRAAAGQPPFRVLVAPGGDPATVLVPEPLFRLLAADEFAAAAAVRVVECRAVPLGTTVDAQWRITIDVDADRGGVIVLDQSPCQARWRRPEAAAPRGVAVSVAADGSTARLAAVAPGRYRVTLDIEPAVQARGGVEGVAFCLPSAARATLEPPTAPRRGDAGQAPVGGGWHCDRAARGGPWLPAPVAAVGGFDVSRATRVRLVRAVDQRQSIVVAPRQATSVNDVAWREDGCVVTAAFEVGAENEIVRSVVVRPDEGLVPVLPRGDAGIASVWPLEDGRLFVEFSRPIPGRTRVDLEFSKPFPDPVGIFDVPGAWLDGVATDARTVRLSAPPDLNVEPTLPGGVSLLRSRDENDPEVVVAWRADVTSPSPAGFASESAKPGRGRIRVARQPRPLRGIQSLVVGFAADAITLELTCELDASMTPLAELPIELPAEAVVDRVGVVGTEDGRRTPVDIVSSRPTPDRLLLVPQRPRTGRFTMTIEARLPGPPPPKGRLPLARAANLGSAPLEVGWRSGTAGRVIVDGGDAEETTREVAPGDDGPEYAVVAAAVAEEPAGRPAAERGGRPIPASVNAIVAAEVRLVTDGRGRARGRARFDLTTPQTSLDVTLPAGMRLFDILVDGRESEAEPLGGDAWRVPLNAVNWPHTLILTYAGDVGGAPAGGDPIRLVPPRLEGFGSCDTLWTIDAPAELTLRVAEPGRLVDGAELAAIRGAARRRLAAGFEAGLATAGPVEAGRLQRLLEQWSDGDAEPVEAVWMRSIDPVDIEPRERVHVVAAEGAVTVRCVRRTDASSPGRGLATVVAAGMLAAGWSIARRWPSLMAATVDRAWPALLVGAGLAWTALLVPALPGWAMLVVGCAVIFTRFAGGPRKGGPSPVDATVGSTRALIRG